MNTKILIDLFPHFFNSKIIIKPNKIEISWGGKYKNYFYLNISYLNNITFTYNNKIYRNRFLGFRKGFLGLWFYEISYYTYYTKI